MDELIGVKHKQIPQIIASKWNARPILSSRVYWYLFTQTSKLDIHMKKIRLIIVWSVCIIYNETLIEMRAFQCIDVDVNIYRHLGPSYIITSGLFINFSGFRNVRLRCGKGCGHCLVDGYGVGSCCLPCSFPSLWDIFNSVYRAVGLLCLRFLACFCVRTNFSCLFVFVWFCCGACEWHQKCLYIILGSTDNVSNTLDGHFFIQVNMYFLGLELLELL